jgi:hypothetical protein
LKAARDLSFVVLKRWKEALYMNLKGSLKGPVEDKDGQGLSWIYIWEFSNRLERRNRHAINKNFNIFDAWWKNPFHRKYFIIQRSKNQLLFIRLVPLKFLFSKFLLAKCRNSILFVYTL